MNAHKPRFQRTLIHATVFGAVATWMSLPAVGATCTWDTTSGNWNALANWLNCVGGNGNPDGVPGGADTAIIGTGGTVTVSTAQAILTLNNADTVSVLDNVTFSFNARSSAASFTGGGQLVLGGSGSRLFVEGSNGVTLGAGSTIRGAGQVGQAVQQSGASLFTNAGTISADSNGQSLILVNPGNTGSYANNALMEARNGGTLHVLSSVAQGVGGQLRAEAGSRVLLSGATVSGGVVGAAGTGRILTDTSFNNVLSGVTLAGTLDMASQASTLRVLNGLTLNNATTEVGGSSVVFLDNRNVATQTVGGTGTIQIAGGALRAEGAGQTTLGSGVTVAGHGAFGSAAFASGQHTLVNNGLITANVAGQTLFIQPMANGSQAIQNNGVMEAANGGLLALQTNVTGGTTSQLRALAGSTIRFDSVTVSGTINTAGGGTVTALNTNANLLSGVTLNGTLALDTGAAQMRIGNGLVLNGSIGVGGSSNLYIDNRAGLAANQSITGSGSIDLSGGGLRMEGAGTTSTTIGPNIVVRGFGAVGQAIIQATAMTLVNNGTFSADVNGQTLALQTPGSSGVWSNQALLEARNGGTLRLDGNVNQGSAGRIVAEAGSTVVLNGVSIDGGVIGTVGSGTFRATNTNANLMSNTTIDGVVDLTGAAAQLRLANNAVINGRIDVGSLANLYLDTRSGLAANQTLSGNGTIAMSGGAVRMEGAGVTSITVGPDLVVRGFGAIGSAIIQGATTTFTNNGRISADVAGNTLAIERPANSGTWVNQALMDARNGGTLRLDGSVSQGASGVLRAENGSTVFINGVTVAGGVLDSAGTGAIRASNAFANLLSDVRLEGVLELAGSGSQARISNNAVINGRIDVANLGVLTLDSRAPASANQTLSGSGLINLGGGAVRVEGGGQSTIASGLTLAGHGTVGQAVVQSGTHTLVNNGTISASTAGQTLTLQPMANVGGITGTGTLQVAGGTLSVDTGQATQQGRLVIGNAGTLATNNRDITLSADYTSDQWGSGNGFNRRAGVTGSGQILAGGDAAQAITGANVTNGDTTNATLTINNVRVGSTTYNYQIANTGTTGPTLRGAIQTTVNGANLTDARLSGTGVTASNYNTGGPGNNTGDLAVTFTATTAGALASLSGQVLNLTSNFANIPDQRLNIVLGSGAAAYNAAVGSASPSPVQVVNQRIGGSATAALTVANTTAAGAFSEDLNATFGAPTGAASGSGSVAGILAGASNPGAMTVGVNTSTAGAMTGTVTLNYETAGAVNGVSNGLGVASTGSQTITVNGNVFQAASGAIQTAPLNFGTVQVGQSVSQDLVIRNTATGAAGFVEDLNAAFGNSTDARIIGVGALNGILAGTNSTAANGTMNVSINTGAAGTANGSIRVNYTSAGAVNGVSNGLGTLGVGGEDYAANGTIVTGNVVDQAKPVINGVGNSQPVTVNLGNVRINTTAGQTLNVLNQATGNQQAQLNASIASNGAPVTASGNFTGLLPGNSSPPGQPGIGTLQVGIDTSVAGVRNGSATVSLVSDASNIGNCAPNCQLNLPNQTVNVSGTVYRLADPTLNTPAVTIAARVGDPVAANQAVSITNSSLDIFTEGLRVSVAGTSGNAQSNGGSIANLAAQGTDNTTIQVGLASTANAGTTSGQVNLNLVSTGAGTTGASDLNLTPQSVTVNGRVYTPAQADLSGTVNFGIVHVNENAGTRQLTVQNTAAATALNDVLRGTLGASGPFTGGGDLGAGLAAGATQNFAIGLNTGSAGVFNGTATFSGVSHNNDMADLALAPDVVNLSAQVNNYASSAFQFVSGAGAFSGSGTSFTLDFGNIVRGSGSLSSVLAAQNDAVGPADLLDGTFDLNVDDFALSGFVNFSDLDAGASFGGLDVRFTSTTLGTFEDTVVLHGWGHNASGYRAGIDDITLLIRANVVESGQVPEPPVLVLFAGGLLLMVRVTWRRSRRENHV